MRKPSRRRRTASNRSGPVIWASRLRPSCNQMLRREHRAALVIRYEPKGVRLIRLRIDVEDRDIRAMHFKPPARIGPPARHHDPVDALAEERIDVACFALGVVGAVAHEDRDAAVGKVLLQPLHDGDREPAEAVAGDEAHREALSAMQALREVVRAEAHLLRDGSDLGPRLLLQAAAIVEGLRNGADADLGHARHVVNGQRGASRPLRPLAGGAVAACRSVRGVCRHSLHHAAQEARDVVALQQQVDGDAGYHRDRHAGLQHSPVCAAEA